MLPTPDHLPSVFSCSLLSSEVTPSYATFLSQFYECDIYSHSSLGLIENSLQDSNKPASKQEIS